MEKLITAGERIRKSRERSNLLKEAEFATIEYLCARMPQWLTPDMLTVIGVLGSGVTVLGLVMAAQYSKYYLILSVVGFAIQWFGDSLDGRIAYYRNIPRKWYGWALDISADWFSISIIGLGFYSFFPHYKFLAFIFILAYGGSMILSLIQYKINNIYVIDKSIFGPTELRILICIFILAEIWIPNSLIVFTGAASLLLMILNTKEFLYVLKEGDQRDIKAKAEKGQ